MSDKQSSDNKKRYKMYRQLSWYRKKAGLSESDFLELAKVMYSDLHDIESTSDISTQALEDLLFGLKTWFAVQDLRRASGVLLTEARVVIHRLGETAAESSDRQDRDDSWD